MIAAVILARGGSKRIKRKNIKIFHGKPMICWVIDMVNKSGLFDKIIVSTDDKEIASLAKLNGADVPFIRPINLSDDFATTNAVMSHAVSWMKDKNWDLESICCFYGTSVFFQTTDLIKGLDVMNEKKWSYVFSVTDFDYSIFRSFRVKKNGSVKMFFPEHYEKRSQDLPLAMHDAAQFYWGTPSAWINEEKIFDKKSYGVKVPRWRVQDIDNEEDWKRAEIIFKANQLK